MKKLLFLLSGLCAVSVSAQPCFTMTQFGSPIGGTNQIVTADFNKDNKADLAAIGTASVIVWFGSGTGTFTTNATYAVGSGTNYYLCTGDFNNDGNVDIATANFTANSVSVLFGSATGVFGTAATYVVGTGPMSVCTGDFDKDGNADIAATTSTGISVLKGTGGGAFSAATNYSLGGAPEDLCTADFTGDGNLDLVVTDANASNVYVMSGSSTGTFSLTSTVPTNGSNPTGITKLDFNNDGLMDVAVCNEGTNNYCILTNNGSGGFNPMPSISIGGQQQPRNIASADFDGNGQPDVVMADFSNFSPYFASVAYNMSSGQPVSCGSSVDPHGVCTGDFNNDGKPDFAIANQQSSNINVFINNHPIVTVTGNLSICPGSGGTTLSASGASSYTWSSNAGSATTTTVAVNPTGTTTYTVTGSYSGCSNLSTTTTVTVLAGPSSLTLLYNGNSTICKGQSTSLKAVGDAGASYQWLPGSMTTTLVTVTPTVSTTYTVTESYTTGCSLTGTIGVTVLPSPTVSVAPPSAAICYGGTVTLTASGASTYTWNTGISNGTSFTPTATATYSVTGTGSNGCTGTAAASVTVNPLPTVNANASATSVCAGTNIVLTGSGTATTYTWSGGVSNGVPFPATSQTYTVTGVDANNCVNTATIAISAPAPQAPAICMVTVDSLSINNLIIWDKTQYQNADTFMVYRDTANNNYALIAKIPYSALSQYIDTARSISAVNGDPNITTYRYKLAYKDSCGTTSPLSPYHNTIYNYNIGSLFLWNQYQIEGQPTPVPGLSNYVLKRDNLGGTGNYVTAATAGASSTSINDPQYSTWQTTADWRVETVWNILCTPTLRYSNNSTQGTVIKSKSNITNNKTTSVHVVLDHLVSLSPNPGNGEFILHFNSNVKGNIKIVIVDNTGREVYNSNIADPSSGDYTIDLTGYSNGVYLARIITDAGATAKRLIKN